MSECVTETDDDTGHRPRTEPQFEGLDARFGANPDEIYVELRAGSPAYIRLQEGDYLQEGDAFHREQLEVESPTLRTWEVVEITADAVVGRDVDSGEERTWAREDVERKLAVGGYSTNLTDFEWLSVYQVGSWDEYEPDADENDAGETPVDDPNADTRYTGRPYVSVVAYGDNGLKYGRRYRFVEPASDELELWTEDRPRGGFSDEVEARFDRRVREALEAEGYAVVDPDDGEPDSASESTAA